MRRMLVSRSSFEKPRPFERCVRTSSPSSTSTWTPRARSSALNIAASVLLPEPLRPVNQTTNPLDMPLSSVLRVRASITSAERGSFERALFGLPDEEAVLGHGPFDDAG